MGSMYFVQVIVVIGGKGGVGKINVLVNLVLVLVDFGCCVMLLDVDFGLVNVDVLLGFMFKCILVDVIEGCCELCDVFFFGFGGVCIVFVVFGMQSMVYFLLMQYVGLIQVFSDISDNFDVLVVDIVVGIGDLVVSFVCVVQEVLLVVCDELILIIDVYVLIKLFNCDYGMICFWVLVNMVYSLQEGCNLFVKLIKVIDCFFDVVLQYVGVIFYDELVCKVVQKQ